jgi:cell fate (sporulation/competence/biofilm development) regulator YlbF (YheA/YmcA/DUF963 family)
MINVLEQAEHLADAIQKSGEYTEYISLLKKLQEEPDLYARLNDYRKRSFEVQMSSDSDAVKQLENLQVEFAELLADARVSRFLSAEQAFCKMMRQVNEKIMGSIEQMDVSFL